MSNISANDRTPATTTRRRGRPAGAKTPRTTRPVRRRSVASGGAVAELDSTIKALIAENRKLKSQLEKFAAKAKAKGGDGVDGRTLAAIARRVGKALSASPAPRRRRRTTKTKASA